ncbi:MAG: hypothetical protein QNJ38_07980 [Prochloraceae cyanobacterium]|nr:hypothetical protein [Prochloraceae cyanobacterium]
MHAIPTEYNGIQFRSRLEAKWAAMFDLLGWPYEYEPCDFKGWIPDFLLKIYTPVFVEVKPVTSFPQEVADKIDKSGCKDECLIVGMSFDFSDNVYGLRLGWLREVHLQDRYWIGDRSAPNYGNYNCVDSYGWEEAIFDIWSGSESPSCSNPKKLIGFCHSHGYWIDRVTGCYDGGCLGALGGESVAKEVQKLWKIAGNKVQWKKPKV